MTRSIMLLQHGHHLWVCFFKQPLCTLFGQLACLTALFECPLLYNRSWSRHQCGGRKSKGDKHRFNFGFKCNRSLFLNGVLVHTRTIMADHIMTRASVDHWFIAYNWRRAQGRPRLRSYGIAQWSEVVLGRTRLRVGTPPPYIRGVRTTPPSDQRPFSRICRCCHLAYADRT